MGTFTAKMAWDGARTKMESPAGHQATAFAISTLIPLDRPPTVQACKGFIRKRIGDALAVAARGIGVKAGVIPHRQDHLGGFCRPALPRRRPQRWPLIMLGCCAPWDADVLGQIIPEAVSSSRSGRKVSDARAERGISDAEHFPIKRFSTKSFSPFPVCTTILGRNRRASKRARVDTPPGAGAASRWITP